MNLSGGNHYLYLYTPPPCPTLPLASSLCGSRDNSSRRADLPGPKWTYDPAHTPTRERIVNHGKVPGVDSENV